MYSYNIFYSGDLFTYGSFTVFSQTTNEAEHNLYLSTALKRYKSKHYSEVMVLIYTVDANGLTVITNEVYQNPLKKLIEINTQAKTAGVQVVYDDSEPDMFDDEAEENHDN